MQGKKQRNGRVQRDKDPVSDILRQAAIRINRKKPEAGLGALNQLASRSSLSQKRKVQILASVADSELKRRQNGGALKAYRKAESSATGDMRAWLRPAIGQVMVLLADLDLNAAVDKADKIVSRSLSELDKFRNQLRWAQTRLKVGMTAAIDAQPHRPSMILCKLGGIFLTNGYPEQALAFFESSLQVAPNGCKARIGLAEIAIRRQAWSDAALNALEAIQKGAFTAKTLAAIPILLSARKAQGITLIDGDLVDGFQRNSRPVRDKAILIIVSTVRAMGDDSWRALADRYLTGNQKRDRIVQTEIRKIRLSDARHQKRDSGLILARASEVLSSPDLRFGEWAAAAKLTVGEQESGRYWQTANHLVHDGIKRFGTKRASCVRHRIALTLIAHHQFEYAVRLLTKAAKDAPEDSGIWGKSHWALGEAFETQKKFSDAAGKFLIIYDNPLTPQRFQVLALVRWATNCVSAGNIELLNKKREPFRKAMARVNDYVLLLDSAQQLIKVPSELNDLAPMLLERGTALAQKIIANSNDPSEARKAWFFLNRRLADFAKNQEIILLWQQMSDLRKEFLWSLEDRFWEGLGYLFRAFRDVGDTASAVALADEYLSHPSTPPDGHAHLGVLMALLDVHSLRADRALARFAQVAATAPAHRMSAYAYYWMAIHAHANGNSPERNRLAFQIKLCLGESPGLFWQRGLWISGLLLENDLDLDRSLAVIGSDSREEATAVSERIREDMKRV